MTDKEKAQKQGGCLSSLTLGEILMLAIAEGEKVIDKYLDDIKKGRHKAEKAAIPPAICSLDAWKIIFLKKIQEIF